MAGIGDGFTQGLQIGQNWRNQKKQREMEQARMELEAQQRKETLAAQKQLQDERLAKDAEQLATRMAFEKEQSGADKAWRSNEAQRDRAAREAEMAARLKAQGDEAAMGRIDRTVAGFNKFAAAQKPPMARVRRQMNPGDPTEGEVTYDIPIEQATRSAAPKAAPYESPYAKDITDAETQLAEQNVQMAEGDSRGGFLGLQSRKGLADEQTQRLVRLKALELQDKVAKGILTREQAAAEAENVKKTYGL